MVYVLIRAYVTEDNPYQNGFVHSRVKSYIKNGIETKVFVINPNSQFSNYEIDNVSVYTGNANDFYSLISNDHDLTICVHFLDDVIIDCLNSAIGINKVYIFVHGYEALYWYQRIFPGTFTSIKVCWNFIHYIKRNYIELKAIRHFLLNTTLDCQFIAVSEWMKSQAESVWKCQGQLSWHIIPNYIDSSQFSFDKKNSPMNYNFLSIRPFSTGKYANDITADLIAKLSKYPEFDSMKITWIGSGLLYNRITKKVKKFGNVNLINRMLSQNEIAEFHKKNGIFICPTRQDAQGVSMCEAMSSGLVPITLYNTAIPEFLPNCEELICHNVDDMVRLALRLMHDEKLYERLSYECSRFINNKCGYNQTVLKELQLFTNS